SILISPLHPSFGSLAAHKPQQQQQQQPLSVQAQQQQQQQPLSVQAVSLFVNFLVDLKKTPSILISPLHPSFGSLAAHKPQQQQQQQQQPLSVQAVSLFVNFLVDLKKTPSILISPLHPSFGSLAAHKPQQQQQQQQQPLSVQAVSLFVNFLVDLKKTHSEVSHASDMPKRQECALTISSEHSDLAAASVIWFTCCCSQAAAAAAAAAAIRAGSQSICEFSGGSEENPSGTGLKRKRRSVLASILISPLHPSFGSLAAHKPQQQQQQQQPLSVQAVSLFVNFLVDLKKTHSEVSHASDMPKRQECALTISSEHSDLAAASVIWFTCCSQAAAAAAAAAAIRAGSQSICEFSGGSEENPSGTGLKRKRRSVLDSEVSHASDMPKRQECALTISSEHSDLAAASVIWFTCCSQAAAAAAAAARYPCRQSVYL
uniref:Rho-GAP domain-containing protein n=1 Tax=Macrostomum lignano TaxID=282301 RepID=A0A1I8HKX3_9PLAT